LKVLGDLRLAKEGGREMRVRGGEKKIDIDERAGGISWGFGVDWRDHVYRCSQGASVWERQAHKRTYIIVGDSCSTVSHGVQIGPIEGI